MFQNQIIRKFLETFDHICCGDIEITLPNGQVYAFSGKEQGPKADVTIYDYRAIRLFAMKGDIGVAESYRDQWWDSKDLVSLLVFCLKNEKAFEKYIYGSFFNRLMSRFLYLLKINTIKGSKKNIHAHYDLGNAFYEIWLDPTMTYSSAIFEHQDEALISGQYRKYDRMIHHLHQSGRLLEIGCGWGGFIERALLKGDYDIKGITISEQQYAYAKNRLNGNAFVANEDYRTQKGTYDQIVSIEMFEAVGEKFWDTYFCKIKNLLAKKGKALIQTITIKDHYFERYRQGGDAIRTFIFPGGMLPSQEKFIEKSHQAGLSVTDTFFFGRDYALTLKHWLTTFETKIDQVKALGFDEKFLRIWRFYLTFCIASFQTGRTNVMQVSLEHQKT